MSPTKQSTDLHAATAGIAILLLVTSDNQALRNQGNALFHACNLIAVPLFFFCMGMRVHIESKQRSLLSLIIGTIKLYGIGIALYAPKQFAVASQAGLQASIHAIFWGTGNSLYNAPLWLLAALVPGLCLCKLGIVAGRPLCKQPSGPLIPLMVVCLTYWLLSTSVMNAHMPRDIWGRPLGLPWSLDLAPFVASMLLLGAWHQAHAQDTHRPPPPRKIVLILMTVAGLPLLLVLHMDPALDLNYRLIQAWPSTLLATVLGVTLSITASHLLCINACKAGRLLALLGRNGLIILIMFWPLQNALVDALPAGAQRSTFAALAVSIILCAVLAGLSQNLLNRHSILKRIAYV